MNKTVCLIILFALLAAGCVYHEPVVTAPPPPVQSSSISAYTMRSGTKVIINLSEQRAYLVEGGKVSLIAPIASGKPGWSTPTGNFAITSKDIDHRSQSFGLIIDGSGRIVTSDATPQSGDGKDSGLWRIQRNQVITQGDAPLKQRF
jgi:lipoprotein-anchoring transpeptidase ErfK/SrfK